MRKNPAFKKAQKDIIKLNEENSKLLLKNTELEQELKKQQQNEFTIDQIIDRKYKWSQGLNA
jgi:hypothetical protein